MESIDRQKGRAKRAARLGTWAASVASLSLVSVASAEIAGFNSLSGWHVNVADAGAIGVPDANTVQLTSGMQRRSIFYNTPQSVSAFSASFNYRASSTSNAVNYQGITFVLQNSPSGSAALGSFLGYSGITNSVGIPLVYYSGSSASGYSTNGDVGAGLESISPANIEAHRDLAVSVTYASPILRVTIDDPTLAGVEFSRNYVVPDLASVVGGPTAYIGFTAGTFDNFGNGGATQFLSNFQFTTVPEPSIAIALLVPAAMIRRRSR